MHTARAINRLTALRNNPYLAPVTVRVKYSRRSGRQRQLPYGYHKLRYRRRRRCHYSTASHTRISKSWLRTSLVRHNEHTSHADIIRCCILLRFSYPCLLRRRTRLNILQKIPDRRLSRMSTPPLPVNMSTSVHLPADDKVSSLTLRNIK